jgi:hypothetical protein
MRNSEKIIRMLVAETLLLEDIQHKHARVYHGSESPPSKFIQWLEKDEFRTGEGGGSLFGKGLYTVYDLNGSSTARGIWGNYIYKLKVNLYGMISFIPSVTETIYGKRLEPYEQAKLLGYKKRIIDSLNNPDYFYESIMDETNIILASKFLSGSVKGIIYNRETDGNVVVIYDAAVVIPIAHSVLDLIRDRDVPEDEKWTKISKDEVKGSIRRSGMNAWKEEKYDKYLAAIREFNSLAKKPPAERVWNSTLTIRHPGYKIPENTTFASDLIILSRDIRRLPKNLTVFGKLRIAVEILEEIGENLKVSGDLILKGSFLKSLPKKFSVGGTIDLYNSQQLEYIPENLEVNGSLILGNCENLSRLPENLHVGGDLKIYNTKISKLPDSLRVEQNIIVNGGQIVIHEAPDHLMHRIREWP